jgi:hypothetical protein
MNCWSISTAESTKWWSDRKHLNELLVDRNWQINELLVDPLRANRLAACGVTFLVERRSDWTAASGGSLEIRRQRAAPPG